MKYLFILFFLTSIYYSNAQKSFFHPKLSKNLTLETSRVSPFAIANNESNIAFISAHQIPIIFQNNSFLIDAIVENDKSSLNSNILKLLNLSFENIIIDDAIFKTNNEFSLEIDEKFKVKNIILNSDINITQLKYKNLNIINKYFPEVDDLILFDNHKLNLNYKDKNLSINGEGQIQLNTGEIDEIKYFINKKDNDLSIDSELFLKNIVLEQQDFLKIFFPQNNKKRNCNNQKVKSNVKKKKLTCSGAGKFKSDKDL